MKKNMTCYRNIKSKQVNCIQIVYKIMETRFIFDMKELQITVWIKIKRALITYVNMKYLN